MGFEHRGSEYGFSTGRSQGKLLAAKNKLGKTMFLATDPAFSYTNATASGSHMILEYPHGKALVSIRGLSDLLFVSHDWSGFAEISYQVAAG